MIKQLRKIPLLAVVLILFFNEFAYAQTTVTIGTGTSSSSTRGPFQRADTNSSTVYSRWHQIYTAAELATAGIANGVSISELKWDVASSNTIIGAGNANIKVYIKNSSADSATADTWVNLTMGSTLALDSNLNTVNNFPGANGWMGFPFDAPFTYTGGAIEISVDWDCSQVATPAFSGNGAIKFRWSSTSPVDLVAKKGASSSSPSTLSDLADQRANIQIVYNTASCDAPAALGAMASTTTADVNWSSSSLATSYNWKVVATGAGSGATAIASGSTANNMDMATGLMALTGYDLFVQSDCGTDSSSFAGPYTFLTRPMAQDTVTIGAGTSSSSTRGPFQRSDTNSTTVFSRFVHIYTASELAAAGVMSGTVLTSLNWELASSNVVAGNGSANLKVYIKNSTATSATAGTWSSLTTGSTMVVNNDYNTTNNFPGANGWMAFNFNAPFVYTGGAIEIAVDWDCSQVSTPAFSGDGALKWRWESTAPTDLVVKKTASSSAPSTVSDLKDDRANIQFVFVDSASSSCTAPTGLVLDSATTTSAYLSWTASPTAVSYNWKVVAAGAGSGAAAVDVGTTSGVTVVSAGLTVGTSYDLYVESNCGADTSSFTGPLNFSTDNTIGLSQIEILKDFSLSPNPTSGIAEMELHLSLNADIEVAIYSTKGELLGRFYQANSSQLVHQIDLSSYKNGLYFVRVKIDEQIISKKILLNK